MGIRDGADSNTVELWVVEKAASRIESSRRSTREVDGFGSYFATKR